jgi:hypothetical protein
MLLCIRESDLKENAIFLPQEHEERSDETLGSIRHG